MGIGLYHQVELFTPQKVFLVFVLWIVSLMCMAREFPMVDTHASTRGTFLPQIHCGWHLSLRGDNLLPGYAHFFNQVTYLSLTIYRVKKVAFP